ncbi:uncharacterized protein SEPMUDRAFT_115773 [Sphaerulina musiva SO2202]|uniref:Uncharacterized protein n=1 Tax=Sphaerulina musiva (strain SO2202) TaxID=692275 RepID=M3D9F0_SPHMS|nr:uncharacterized protein SEPMUDRAFT_115773 [Sphaerulina musiva SO2202]EMF14504.1 hypothetical protein SEPMUDRAFT_115773 [Sphaerulina musiva SO2202]
MHGAAIVKSVYTGLEQVVVAASCVDVQVSDAATPGQSRQSTAQVLRLLTGTHTPSELDELDGWNDVRATWPSSSWQIAQLSLTAGSHNMNMQTAAKSAASTTLSGRLPNRSTSTVSAVMHPLERNKGICLDNLREIFNTMVKS